MYLFHRADDQRNEDGGVIMRIATAWSTVRDEAQAVKEVCRSTQKELGVLPSFAVVSYTEGHSPAALQELFSSEWPNTVIHGSSSCLATMTQAGFHSEDNRSLAVFAILDENGAYGSTLTSLSGDPKIEVKAATKSALSQANRSGEMPAIIWLSSSPGCEEEIIGGIQEALGPHVPIYGGSSADNTIAGNWSLFSSSGHAKSGCLISALYPDATLTQVFSNGYVPSGQKASVTRSQGRKLFELDGKPAAALYNEWLEGALSDDMAGGNILGKTTMAPLGVKDQTTDDGNFFRVIHPETIAENQTITLFANIENEETVYGMTSTTKSLVTRGRSTVRAARMLSSSSAAVQGALLTYCAGCMLSIPDDRDELVSEIAKELDGRPFMGQFTFGEQGSTPGGTNVHGNLMVSAVLFQER